MDGDGGGGEGAKRGGESVVWRYQTCLLNDCFLAGGPKLKIIDKNTIFALLYIVE